MGKLMIKNSFSDRNKTIDYPRTIQKNELNDITRNDIANIIHYYLEKLDYHDYNHGIYNATLLFVYSYTIDVLHQIYTDKLSFHLDKTKTHIMNVIKNYEYDDVLAVLEFISKSIRKNFKNLADFNKFEEILNNCFEDNYVGYRFLNSEIIPITDEVEIEEINKAIESSEEVGNPLKKALNFMSITQKDYQNVIKESVIAVETALNLYYGNKKTFGQNWEKFSTDNNLHPKLKESLGSLYGYTCDIGGVRHGGDLSYANVSYEEAQYVLVTCSGIINFIKSKSSKKK